MVGSRIFPRKCTGTYLDRNSGILNICILYRVNVSDRWLKIWANLSWIFKLEQKFWRKKKYVIYNVRRRDVYLFYLLVLRYQSIHTFKLNVLCEAHNIERCNDFKKLTKKSLSRISVPRTRWSTSLWTVCKGTSFMAECSSNNTIQFYLSVSSHVIVMPLCPTCPLSVFILYIPQYFFLIQPFLITPLFHVVMVSLLPPWHSDIQSSRSSSNAQISPLEAPCWV